MNLMLINTTTSEPGALIFRTENEKNNAKSKQVLKKTDKVEDKFKNNLGTIADEKTQIFRVNAENYDRHSESLLPAIEKLLSDAEMELHDLSAIAVITGPGSFTGIRVGLATVKAFYAVKQISVLSANIFEALSGYVDNGVVLIQSTSTSFYYGIIENSMLKDYGVVGSENLKEFLINENKRVFCYEHELESLQNSYNDIETINNINNIYYKFFANDYGQQKFRDINTVEPFYIQLSQAEREFNKNKGKLTSDD